MSVVVGLALGVPGGLNALRDGERARQQAANTTRATLLATAVLEAIMADVASDAPGLGFAALASPSTYLDTPGDGLYDRLETTLEPFSDAGLGYSVSIGGLVSADGSATGDADLDLFRTVIVTVTFPGPAGTTLSMLSGVMVGDFDA